MTITLYGVSVQKSCQLQKWSFRFGQYDSLKIYLVGPLVIPRHPLKVGHFQLKSIKVFGIMAKVALEMGRVGTSRVPVPRVPDCHKTVKNEPIFLKLRESRPKLCLQTLWKFHYSPTNIDCLPKWPEKKRDAPFRALGQGCQKGRGAILYLSSQPWKIFASSGGLVEHRKISRCTKFQPIWFIRGLDGPKSRGPRPAAAGRTTALIMAIKAFSERMLQ